MPHALLLPGFRAHSGQRSGSNSPMPLPLLVDVAALVRQCKLFPGRGIRDRHSATTPLIPPPKLQPTPGRKPMVAIHNRLPKSLRKRCGLER